MTTKKLTVSIPTETYTEFKQLAIVYGLNISGWITTQMRNELDKATERQERYNDAMKVFGEILSSGIDHKEAKKILLKVYGETIVRLIYQVVKEEAE